MLIRSVHIYNYLSLLTVLMYTILEYFELVLGISYTETNIKGTLASKGHSEAACLYITNPYFEVF